MTATSKKAAWDEVNKIFPTDYERSADGQGERNRDYPLRSSPFDLRIAVRPVPVKERPAPEVTRATRA